MSAVMTINPKKARHLRATTGYRMPDREQGAWIAYRMELANLKPQAIADSIGVSREMVRHVMYGLRTSARVQKAIAAALGFSSWAEILVEKGRAA